MMGGEADPQDVRVDQVFASCSEFAFGKGRWLHGSAVDRVMTQIQSRPILSLEQLITFHSSCNAAVDGDCIAVAELFGGIGYTTHLVAKIHGLKTGVNFDITSGFDLRRADDTRMLVHYVSTRRPLVLVMAPPCKGFGALQHLNKIINPSAWQYARQEGLPLAKLCARLAELQIEGGRHFIVEQPAGSTMFQLPEWKKLASDHKLYQCQFDQCCVGLRMNRPPYLPVRKPTVLISSKESLIRRFVHKQCPGDHEHASISSLGGNRHYVNSCEMQVWPINMCRMIAAAIADTVHEHVLSQRLSGPYMNSSLAYAGCVGCKQHLRKDDPLHDRGPTCKFPDVESVRWSCPACEKKLPRANASHKLDHTCKWAVARVAAPGQARERRGAHPRDGRIPAAADPTAEVRLSDLDDRDRAEPSSASGHRPVALSPGEEPLSNTRKAPNASGPAGARFRDAAAQVSEGGLGVGGEVAGIRAVRMARDGSGLAEPDRGIKVQRLMPSRLLRCPLSGQGLMWVERCKNFDPTGQVSSCER